MSVKHQEGLVLVTVLLLLMLIMSALMVGLERQLLETQVTAALYRHFQCQLAAESTLVLMRYPQLNLTMPAHAGMMIQTDEGIQQQGHVYDVKVQQRSMQCQLHAVMVRHRMVIISR